MNLSALQLGYFNFEFMGLFWGIAFWLFVSSWYYSQQEKQRQTLIHHLWQWFLISLLVGHVFNLLIHFELWFDYGFLTPFIFWKYAPHYLGVLLGLCISLYWTLKDDKNESLGHWFDTTVFPLFRALLCVDIAFFLTGTIYGKETQLPWGYAYETYGVDLLAPLHPVGIYLLIAHYFLYRFLRRKAPSMSKFPGKLFLITLLLLALINFIALFIRADVTPLWSFLTVEHIESAMLMVLAVVLLKKLNIPTRYLRFR